MGDGEFVPCDRCRHRSYGQVFLRNDGELTYCGHHLRKYTPRLRELGAIIIEYPLEGAA